MAIIRIKNITDPQITAYRELKDKNLLSRHGLFIAEGEHLVKRLIESEFETHSLLVQESRLHAFSETSFKFPVFVATAKQISQIVGFKFHRGVLALGIRKPTMNVDTMMADAGKIQRLVILPEINDVENLGGLFRTCAALGYKFIILGPSCCDPFARRAIRTSVGTLFKLSISRSDDIIRDVALLKKNHNFDFYAATTVESSSLPKPSTKLGLVFGSEADGLPADIIDVCDDNISVPMSTGVDSLNVVVAAGILLNHYRCAPMPQA
jgi:tRNA G18 (ribose-2'-O)-methylase SpoU